MKKKNKILYLRKILLKTDELNPISTMEIIEKLHANGINVNRKTLGDDIKLLMDDGLDIITVRSSQNMYYVGMREFESPEIKLLVDAIESSKVLTYKKSKKLIEKLLGQISWSEAELIKQECALEERVKPSNEEIYYSIDRIQNAILKNKVIQFQYKDFNQYKELVYKHNGEIYHFSPYNLIWHGDYYYAVGYSHKHNSFGSFRVDRMAHTMESDEIFIDNKLEYKRINYSKQCFSMFGGEKQNIEMLCNNDLMKVIFDRFGGEVTIEITEDDKFIVKTEVLLSPTFYGWLFQFYDQVKLVSPDSSVQEYQEYLSRTMRIYNELNVNGKADEN